MDLRITEESSEPSKTVHSRGAKECYEFTGWASPQEIDRLDDIRERFRRSKNSEPLSRSYASLKTSGCWLFNHLDHRTLIAVEDLKAKTNQVQTKENPVTADRNGEPGSPKIQWTTQHPMIYLIVFIHVYYFFYGFGFKHA